MEEEYGFDIITVTDDDGVEHSFEEIDRIETDDGRKFVAVLEQFDNPKDMLEDDGEVICLEVIEENGETMLVEIQDENDFEEIREIFEERINEMFEFDEEETES